MASAVTPPEVNGAHGSVTLGELTGTGLILRPGSETEGQSFEFTMPIDAAQGPEVWYLNRLIVSVTFTKGSDQGSVTVTSSANGEVAEEIEFRSREKRAGRPVVSWKTADLIRGSYGGQAMGRTAHLKHESYLLSGSVEGGPGYLTFSAEPLGGAKVEKVEIGPASGIYATPVGWVELDLEANFADEVSRVGERNKLEVTVINRSRREAKAVGIAVDARSSDMFIDGPARQVVGGVQSTATRSFVIGRTKPGELQVVVVAADGPSGETAKATVSAPVVAGGSDLSDGVRALLVIALLCVLGGAALISRRQEDNHGI